MKEHKFGAILSYVNLALTNITGLLLTPFVIKMLGDSEYGLYTLIGAFVGYLSVLDLGLNNAIVRFVAQYRVQNDEKSQENFLAISLIIYSFIGFLIIVFGALFYYNIHFLFQDSLSINEIEKAKIMLLILLFNIAITIPGGAFTGICSGYEKFIFPRMLTIVKILLRTITVVLILKYGSDAIGIVIVDTLINLLFIGGTVFYTFSILKVKVKLHEWNLYYVKEIFQYSFWVFVFALVYQFQWRTGQVILGATTNTITVAVFGVGVMLGIYFTSFGNIINGLFLPKAVQAIYNEASSEELTNQMIRVGRISLIILLYVFGSFLLTGKDFVVLWVGKNYLSAYYVALLIMFVYILPIAQGYAHAILEAKKMLRFKSITFLVFSIIGTLMGYWLSKSHGIYGMIVGLVVAIAILQVIMNFYYKKKIGLNIKKFFYMVMLRFLLFFCIIIVSCFFLFHKFEGITWIMFFIKNCVYTLLFLATFYFLINEEEKKLIFKR